VLHRTTTLALSGRKTAPVEFTGRKASKRTRLTARHAKLDAIRQAEDRLAIREAR
jgi:hypothetical protein